MTASNEENTSEQRAPWVQNQFAKLLHLPPISASDNSLKLELVVEEIHLRTGGVVHGGIFATLLDTITGYAAYRAAPKGAEVLTIQLNVNMTATARLSETIVATAQVVHAGRRTAVVTGELRLPTGKLLATGSGTFFFVEGGLIQ